MEPEQINNRALATDVSGIARINAVPTLLEGVCRTTGMGFAAIARVTEDRWIACAVRDEIAFGLKPGGELKVETTICDEIRRSGNAVIIDHVAEDPHYRAHYTPAMYGFQSYISIPILRADGSFFGTLCAIDPRPAKLDRPEIVGMFRLFAQLVAFYLDTSDQMQASETALLGERQALELRDQFIAVLGHDLRNPLASIAAGTKLLRKEQLSERSIRLLGLMEQSVGRMSTLIENVLDLVHRRLGGAAALNRTAEANLNAMLRQVVDELSTAWPDRIIEARFLLEHGVNCDVSRIGRVLSNLLANAITHGAPDKPVLVVASANDAMFEMSVTNEGQPIPLAIIEKLFQPYFRGREAGSEGLGLGLYIANEIIKAHGRVLEVLSNESMTRFTARIPAVLAVADQR